MDFELLKKLTDVCGVAGSETEVRKLVLGLVKPLADEVRVDKLGNVICLRKGTGKAKNRRRLMLSAHMDEIGLLINYIDERGFIRFVPVGGIDPRTLLAQRVIIHTETGDLPGVIGTKPIHLMEAGETSKAVSFADLFIDTGLSGPDAVRLVKFGDTVTMDRPALEMGECVTAKAIDDRVGIYTILNALKKTRRQECDLYAVFTVQEEIGIKGATVAAFGVEPDIAIAIDSTSAADIPGNSPQNYVTASGGGIAISGMDARSISNIKVVKFFKQLAEKNKIRHQMKFINKGGTDASAMQLAREGAAVCTLSVPTRYVHSCVESVRKTDIDAAVELLAEFIKECHKLDYSL